MQEQPFLTDLKLGKLLSNKFYGALPIQLLSPVVVANKLQAYKGYYINPDKTIDIYGEDKFGISLKTFWKNLVIKDLYGRPRRFLQLNHDYTAPYSYRPRITKNTKKFEVKDEYDKPVDHYLMPVSINDLKPGDIRPSGENYIETEIILSIELIAEGGIRLHLLNQFMESHIETYSSDDVYRYMEEEVEDFYTIVPVKK